MLLAYEVDPHRWMCLPAPWLFQPYRRIASGCFSRVPLRAASTHSAAQASALAVGVLGYLAKLMAEQLY